LTAHSRNHSFSRSRRTDTRSRFPFPYELTFFEILSDFCISHIDIVQDRDLVWLVIIFFSVAIFAFVKCGSNAFHFSNSCMFPKSTWQSARPGVAATLVLLAAALMAPSRADASCGDYVMIGGRQVGDHSPYSSQDSQAPAMPRCRGPHCSDNSLPPATPTPKTEVTAERWAIFGCVDLDVLPSHDVLLADACDSPSDGHGLSILRPPR
jgi:hypothetical protein